MEDRKPLRSFDIEHTARELEDILDGLKEYDTNLEEETISNFPFTHMPKSLTHRYTVEGQKIDIFVYDTDTCLDDIIYSHDRLNPEGYLEARKNHGKGFNTRVMHVRPVDESSVLEDFNEAIEFETMSDSSINTDISYLHFYDMTGDYRL